MLILLRFRTPGAHPPQHRHNAEIPPHHAGNKTAIAFSHNHYFQKPLLFTRMKLILVKRVSVCLFLCMYVCIYVRMQIHLQQGRENTRVRVRVCLVTFGLKI